MASKSDGKAQGPDRPKDGKAEYTIDEVARRLKVTRETVRRYIRSKRLAAVLTPVRGLKKEYRISQVALSKFLALINSEDAP